MNKKKLHHFFGELKGLKTWQLVVIAVLLSAVTIGLLRHNSITAINKFQQVQHADKTGDDVYKELRDLQRYVSHHMNTHIDRITLEYTYTRDYKAALEQLASSGGINQNADYKAAQEACAYLESERGHAAYVQYAKCVEEKLAQAAPGENPALDADLPKPVRYQYEFVSPVWSPDAAGWMVLATGVLWLIIIGKVLLQLLFWMLLRRKHA